MALKPRLKKTYVGVACPHCAQPLQEQQQVSGSGACPHCQREFQAVYFRPPARKIHVAQVGTGPDANAVCAKHENNVAVANCTRCGNFMCGLCKTELEDMTLCPPCVDRLAAEGALPTMTPRYKNYAGMASTYALVGLLCVGFILGPIAVYCGVRALGQKQVFGSSGWRTAGILLAMLLGFLEGVAGVIGIIGMVARGQ